MTDDVLKVGSLAARAGEKRYGVEEFLVQGEPYHLPLWIVNGGAPGPTLVVTAGVHAAGDASIAAALDFGRPPGPATPAGRLIVMPVMNQPAFAARSIYVCPLDGRNLNRAFPGNPQGTASEQIAAWVFGNVIARGDCYVDLHGGDRWHATGLT